LQSTLHGIPRQRIVSIFGVLVPPLWWVLNSIGASGSAMPAVIARFPSSAARWHEEENLAVHASATRAQHQRHHSTGQGSWHCDLQFIRASPSYASATSPFLRNGQGRWW